MNTEQTPLKALQARKQQLQFEAHIQEDKISGNIKYIQHNGGKLILQSATSAIFPGIFTAQSNPSKPSTRSLGITDLAKGGVSSVLKGNKGIFPIVWSIAQPFILTWGIKGAKKLIGGLFGKKRIKK